MPSSETNVACYSALHISVPATKKQAALLSMRRLSAGKCSAPLRLFTELVFLWSQCAGCVTTGFESMDEVPRLFVLMGNFQSLQSFQASGVGSGGGAGYAALRESFNALAAMMRPFRRIRVLATFDVGFRVASLCNPLLRTTERGAAVATSSGPCAAVLVPAAVWGTRQASGWVPNEAVQRLCAPAHGCCRRLVPNVCHGATFPWISVWQEASKLVFVPGPGDPGAGDVLPRPPLPTYFTEKLAEEVHHVQ